MESIGAISFYQWCFAPLRCHAIDKNCHLRCWVIRQSNQETCSRLPSCSCPCLMGSAVAVITVRAHIVVGNIGNSSTIRYSSCSVWKSYRLVHSFLRVLKYLSIGALSYGYPALLMLWVTYTDSQNSVNAFDVYWLPWSLCKVKLPFEMRCASSAFCSVRIARSLVIYRSVTLATTLRS